METKAHYVLIGAFTMAVVAGAMGFIFWAAKGQMKTQQYDHYEIEFNSTVAGLSVAGDVLFNGIKVGQVTAINIDKQDPGLVRVMVRINDDTPVRKDSVAKLEPQGITGVSYIQISGGHRDSPMLEPARPGHVPVIQSAPSSLQELMANAPELLNRGIELLDKLNSVVDAENRGMIKNTLKNIDEVSKVFARQSLRVGEILDHLDTMAVEMTEVVVKVDQALKNINEMVKDVNSVAVTADGFIKDDLRETLASARSLVDNVNGLVTEIRPGVSTFSDEGLVQISRFLEDAKHMVNTLDRVLQRLESDPDRFFFGDQIPERQVRQGGRQ